MATLSITKKFTNPTGHIVANAQEIAYEEGTGGSGALIYDRTVVSVKDKIDALLQSINTNTASIGTIQSAITQIQSTLETLDLDADNVVYSDNVTVKDKLDELAQAINNISQLSTLDADHVIYSPAVLYTYEEYIALPGNSGVTQEEFNALSVAEKTKIEAVDSKEKIDEIDSKIETERSRVNTISNALEVLDAEDVSFTPTGGQKTTVHSVLDNFQSQVSLVNEKATQVNTVYNNISSTSGKIDNLEEMASDLVSSLDTSAQFIICSSNTYNNIDKSNNTIYFCYDEDDQSNIATLTTSVNDVLYGQVIGGGSYTKGTQITLIALPNNGYDFEEWSDGSSQNPYSITLDDDTSLTATFVSS